MSPPVPAPVAGYHGKRIRLWLATIVGRSEILLEAPPMPLTPDMVIDVESIRATAISLRSQWQEIVDTAGEDVADDKDITPHLRSLRRLFLLPLRTITAHCEWLLERIEEAHLHRLEVDVRQIEKAARSLLEHVDEVAGLVPSSAAPRVAETATVGASAGRILVVDDSRTNRLILSTHLQSHGFEVVTASSGFAALEAALDGQIDLVLLDVVMEGMSGLEVLRLLRLRHSVAELPIIMVTAMQATKDTVEALDMGANDYVTKPIDFHALLARMRTQLSLKRASEEIRNLNATLSQRNEFIRATMDRYLSTQVVESLLETPDGLKLGGELRTSTILMSDLRGFTTLTQSLHPEQVVRLLNRYLGAMSEIIRELGGTVDEFIGDAILALFGAPIQADDDAERAVVCAVRMQRAIKSINRSNRQEGLPDIQMGIAVNTGEVIVGNIGSMTRAKYGAIGNPVNKAARIESYTVGGQVLISETTLAATRHLVEVDAPQVIQAQGLREALEMFNVRAVRGRYDLQMPSFESCLVPLESRWMARCAIMLDKRQQGDEFQMDVVAVSRDEVCLEGERELEPHALLRMRFTSLAGGEVTGDAYGKLVRLGEAGGCHLLRFTARAPEVEAWLDGLLVEAL